MKWCLLALGPHGPEAVYGPFDTREEALSWQDSTPDLDLGWRLLNLFTP